jgi:hypothetical protein
MCGEKRVHNEGALERHDTASWNQVLQRGDATCEAAKVDTIEVAHDKGAMQQAAHARGDAARAAQQGKGEGSA